MSVQWSIDESPDCVVGPGEPVGDEPHHRPVQSERQIGVVSLHPSDGLGPVFLHALDQLFQVTGTLRFAQDDKGSATLRSLPLYDRIGKG